MKEKTPPKPKNLNKNLKENDAVLRWDNEGGAPPLGDRSHKQSGKSPKTDKPMQKEAQARRP